MIVPAAGFVLAGGRSTRMGRDKALLEIDGEMLIRRGLRQLGEVCSEVAIAGGSPELARYGRLVEDRNPGMGPLSGIVAALESTSSTWNLFCPVDAPFVPGSAWQMLLEQAANGSADAVLARVCGQVQPLCGLYHRQTAAGLRAQLEAKLLKVTSAIEATGRVLWVDFDAPEEQAWFRNLNTPEDYDRIAHPKSQAMQTGSARHDSGNG